MDGIVTMRFQDINAALEAARAEIKQKYQPEKEDTTLKALQASQIREEDYFCHVTHKEWDAILHDIRLAHENDTESALDHSNTLKMIADAERALRFPGNALDKFCYVMCSQLQISYEKLTDKERADLKSIMKKSGIFKDSPWAAGNEDNFFVYGQFSLYSKRSDQNVRHVNAALITIFCRFRDYAFNLSLTSGNLCDNFIYGGSYKHI